MYKTYESSVLKNENRKRYNIPTYLCKANKIHRGYHGTANSVRVPLGGMIISFNYFHHLALNKARNEMECWEMGYLKL